MKKKKKIFQLWSEGSSKVYAVDEDSLIKTANSAIRELLLDTNHQTVNSEAQTNL